MLQYGAKKHAVDQSLLSCVKRTTSFRTHLAVKTKRQPADIMENFVPETDSKLLSSDETLQSQAEESSKSLVDSPVVAIEVGQPDRCVRVEYGGRGAVNSELAPSVNASTPSSSCTLLVFQ